MPYPSIRAVTFDVDDTLFDFQACMARCGDAVLREFANRFPHTRHLATPERFNAQWQAAAAAAQRAGGVIDWPAVRQHGIELLLAECRCDPALAEQLTVLYFEHRHRPTEPFPDAAAAVPELAALLPLGVITNANTRLESLGLASHFSVALTPTAAGCAKPDPRIFHQAAAALGCAPAELLHVGDRWGDDVAGALNAGCHAAWYCRTPQPPGGERTPHLVYADHRELVAWVRERLASE